MTYNLLSISGRITEIIVAKPAAFARFEIISRPRKLSELRDAKNIDSRL